MKIKTQRNRLKFDLSCRIYDNFLIRVSNIIPCVETYINVEILVEMKNQFERTIRTKLGIHEGELDAADLLKITTLQINSASQEDINDLFLTPGRESI